MKPRRFRRVLVACRGAAALRVLRSTRDAGLESVVLTREEDVGSAWPEAATFVSWLPNTDGAVWPDPAQLVARAIDGGCDVVHPGWARVGRDPRLVAALGHANMPGVGSTAEQAALAADRSVTRSLAEELQVPVVPGSGLVKEIAGGLGWLAWAGYPAVMKPVEAVRGRRAQLLEGASQAEVTIRAALERGPVMLERHVRGAREVEVPFIGDGQGGVLTLADREVTARLGSTRIWVEAPAAGLTDRCRGQMRDITLGLAKRVRWRGTGALRFLITPDGRPYLLKVRAGLEPWHCVTERLLGVDLVDAGLRLAAGEPLRWRQSQLVPKGHVVGFPLVSSVRARVLGVDVPADLRFDASFAIRDEVMAGDRIGTLVASGSTRQAAIVRARVAMDEEIISGPALDPRAYTPLFDARDFWAGPIDRDRFRELVGVVWVD